MERRRSGSDEPTPLWVHLATVVVVTAAIAVALGSQADEPSSNLGEGDAFDSSVDVGEVPAGLPAADDGRPASAPADQPGAASGPAPAPGEASGRESGPPRIELVGDSLLDSATAEVIAALGDVVVGIDAVPGRTTRGGREAITLSAAVRPDVLIISLGTNDVSTSSDMFRGDVAWVEQAVTGVPCVVWVDAQEFEPALSDVNSALARVADRSPNMHLARWSLIAGPASLHTEDGYHLSDEGKVQFSELIATAAELFCLS